MVPFEVLENDSDFMELALELARQAANIGEVPVGAVLVCDGQVVAEAYNKRERLQLAGAHAEVLAIGKANQLKKSWRLENCTMYVTLEPCPMCAGTILNSRIKRLVYGAHDPKSGAVSSLYKLLSDERLNHQVEVTSGILAEESEKLLKEFFANLRASKKVQ